MVYFDFKIFKVWPNSTSGKVKIALESDSSEDAYLQVYDLMGRKLMYKKLEMDSKTFYDEVNLESVDSGIYFFKIIQGKKGSVVKIIKK